MYEYLRGQLTELTPASAVVEAGGVGYFLNISLHTFSALEGQAGSEAKVYVQLIVRDDAQLFYGFATPGERELFRLLTSVSGVGVATARMILSTYSPAQIASMISTENTALLKNVKGLGLKTAAKIVLELRDKILGVVTDDEGGFAARPAQAAPSGVAAEAVSALVMLGFAKAPSTKVVQAITAEHPEAEVEEVIRLALKKL